MTIEDMKTVRMILSKENKPTCNRLYMKETNLVYEPANAALGLIRSHIGLLQEADLAESDQCLAINKYLTKIMSYCLDYLRPDKWTEVNHDTIRDAGR